MAKKWRLARSSVHRLLLSATEEMLVKGRGAASLGGVPLLPPFLCSTHTCPYFKCTRWFPPLLPYTLGFQIAGRMPVLFIAMF